MAAIGTQLPILGVRASGAIWGKEAEGRVQAGWQRSGTADRLGAVPISAHAAGRATSP